MQSDMLIPRTSDIIARALDIRESAVRLHDEPAAEHMTTLIKRLPGARFAWQLGTLIVRSPSGNTYRVSNGGCNCLNGQAGKRDCWHWALFGILGDVADTIAETADMEADGRFAPLPDVGRGENRRVVGIGIGVEDVGDE